MKRLAYPLLLLVVVPLLSCEKERTLPAQCALEPDPGLCNAAFTRYYYDKKAKRCKGFTWCGCGGVVPFQTLEECKECSGEK